MATREELVLLAAESPWSRGVTVPAYRRPAADVGSPAFVHDHRYMVVQAGVTWGHGFRKQETQRGVLARASNASGTWRIGSAW